MIKARSAKTRHGVPGPGKLGSPTAICMKNDWGMRQMMSVKIDAAGFQSADNLSNDTTYYCGQVVVGSEVVLCHGTDRDSVNCYDDILAAACRQLGVAVPDESGDEFMFLIDSNSVFELMDDFTAVVSTSR